MNESKISKLDIYYIAKWFKNEGYSDELIDDCLNYVFRSDMNWRSIYKAYEERGVKMKERTDTRHLCPVCGKYEFENKNSFDICPVCNWEDDGVQLDDPDWTEGANQMSLNEAREAYKNGLQVL